MKSRTLEKTNKMVGVTVSVDHTDKSMVAKLLSLLIRTHTP